MAIVYFAQVIADIEGILIDLLSLTLGIDQHGIKKLLMHNRHASLFDGLGKSACQRMNAGGDTFHAFRTMIHRIHPCQIGQ